MNNKTNIDFIESNNYEDFKKDLQKSIDAIELNINNKIIDIKYSTKENIYNALIVYKTSLGTETLLESEEVKPYVFIGD